MSAALEVIIEGLQAVLRGERTPAQAALVMENAGMLLQDLALSTRYVDAHEELADR